MRKKQIIISVVLTIIFIVVLLSWNLFQDKPEPIIAKDLDLAATVLLNEKEIMSDSIVTINYEWKTGPAWVVPDGEPALFVHLLQDDGERLCQDDHIPPTAITEWEPNQTYSYSRHMYVPITLLKKKISLLVGVYNKSDSNLYYAIKGLKQYNPYHRYLAKDFVLIPSDREYSEALLKYTKGWYDPEVDKRGNIKWRWMKQSGEVKLMNPKADAELFIDAWLPNQQFDSPATLRLLLNGNEIEVPALQHDILNLYTTIPTDVLGENDYVDLVIETDKTFVPARSGNSVDPRELGIMVKKILFRAK